MAARVRSHDWNSTSLGPVENWSGTLLTTVNLVLASPFPCALFWGRDLVTLYNDAYSPILGSKHPDALGCDAREIWSEAWHILGPQLDDVFQNGGTISEQNELVPIQVRDRVEDFYWTYSLSPVSTGGRVLGVFNACQNTTEEVLSTRKLQEAWNAQRESHGRFVRSEAELRLIANAIPAYISYIDKDLRYVRVNRTYEEWFGRSAAAIAGRLVTDVLGVSFAGVKPYLEAALTGREQHFETRMVTVRQERFLSVSHIPDRDELGNIRGVVVFGHDITERKRAEETLRESEERLQLVLESAALATWFYDPAGEVVVGDEAMCRLFGSKPVGSVAYWIGLIHPEDQERVTTEFAAGLSGEMNYDVEYRVVHEDGFRWVRAKGKLVGHSGGPLRMLGIAEDITARKLTEEALRASELRVARSESQLRFITDALPALISYIDVELRYLWLNRTYEEWFGRPVGTMIGCSVPEVLGDSSGEIVAHLEAAVQGNRQQFETRLVTLQGERILSIEHIPDRGPGGEVCGVVVHAHDITERRRTEEVLRTTEKLAAVGRLASSIAHEINNPLESVTNLLYIAQSSDDLPEIRHFLQMADRELRRVSVISNQTLRFHKQATHPRLVACEDLFEGVLAVHHGRVVNSQVSVEKRMRSLTPVLCFEGEITQVLNNLIGNAVDAMHPGGGRLLIRSRNATDWQTGRPGLMLTVADTGHGMAPETLKKIFEPFFTTKGIGGTGLGLWVSHEIVDRHQGVLRVRSTERPGGSCTVFTLFLPFDAVTR